MTKRYDRELKVVRGIGTATYTDTETCYRQDLEEWCETPQFSLPGERFTFGHPFQSFLHRTSSKDIAIFLTQTTLNKLKLDLPHIEIKSVYCSPISGENGGYLLALEMDAIITEPFNHIFDTL